MIPLTLQELETFDRSTLSVVIPDDLLDSLIGDRIEGTEYYRTLDGDPTTAGYLVLDEGTSAERRVYKTLHTPTGSDVQYRKVINDKYGEVWEVVPTQLKE